MPSKKRGPLIGGNPPHPVERVWHQRLIRCDFSVVGGALRVTPPFTESIAPPGYYMLFIVNNSGVPSHAKYMKLERQ